MSVLQRQARVRISFLIKPSILLAAICIILAGALLPSHGRWHSEESARYACYFVIALFSASLKVRDKESAATTSMSFVFVIIALVELQFLETALIAAAAILTQGLMSRMTRERTAETVGLLVSTLSAALASQAIYRSVAFKQVGFEPPVRLVIAALAAFLAYNVPFAVAGMLGGGFTRKQARDAMHLWSLPYHLIAATVTALYSSIYPFVSWYAAAFLAPMVFLIHRSYEAYMERLERQKRHASLVSDLHLRTIETLAIAIEAKDQTTHDHLKRVQIYAIEIGRELGLSEPDLQALRAAAVLHDIGKLAVPEHILSKPGRLTPEEFDKMKIHPIVGAEIVERARFPYPVAPMIRAHHEKWDGTGYPEGLKAEGIPIGARILAVVDCLDALASDRQYRRAMPIDRAMQEVALRSGRDFDPAVVTVLQRRYRELEAIARQAKVEPLKLSTGYNAVNGSQAAVSADVDQSPPPTPQFVHSIGAAREEVHKLFELAQEIGNSLEMRETFQVLSRGLQPLVPYDAVAVFLDKNGHLVPQYLHGPDASVCTSLSFMPGSGITGWVVANSKPAVNCDPAREGPTMHRFGSMIAVPLSGRQGVLGAISLYNRKRAAYGADHLRLLNAIAPKLSLALENGLTFKRAEDSATTDYLTGLPNAHSLFLHLDRELEVSRCLAAPLGVLVCDLNGFKQINDTLGHLTGNKLLHAVARALESKCREYDYVSRMGGDEFVVVCSGLERNTLAQRIPELKTAIQEAGRSVTGDNALGASFGCAVFPEDGKTADELLAAADRQMYQDKAHQKTGARVHRAGAKTVRSGDERLRRTTPETIVN